MSAAPASSVRPCRARPVLNEAIATIAAAGCDTPRLDAEVLLADVLGVGRERLLTDPGLELSDSALRAFGEHVRRRAREREPVAYIVGRRAFRTIELAVDRRALVPRPETELLVEVGSRLPPGARVLDVGTGSGAVALALKSERPDLRVAGSDISAAALELARANAQRLGLAVRWLHADLLADVADEFDAILANLPYVADRESDSLAPEIMRHEPPSALFGGPDGLVSVRALLRHLRARRAVPLVALEIGAGQARAVRELLAGAGFRRVSVERDLAGIERVLVGEV